MSRGCLPEKVRVSIGSAAVLELTRCRLDARPTTIYLLTYHRGRCLANCGFCPQAKGSEGRADMLSRVTWPPFPTGRVISTIRDAFRGGVVQRVCVQALNYPTVFEDILSLVKGIQSRVEAPISVCCQPLNRGKLEWLKEAGLERICIPLDAANEKVFDMVKGSAAGGPYMWEEQCRVLEEAVEVFGRNRVTTHLIAGLGEKEREMVQTIQWCTDSGVYPGMFAFTPIPGTALENRPQPPLGSYRRIQTAHHLITRGKTRLERMTFDGDGCLVDFGVPKEQLKKAVRSGTSFLTSGCPGCNRPYYNEKPGGPLYNYPRQPLPAEMAEIEKQMSPLVVR